MCVANKSEDVRSLTKHQLKMFKNLRTLERTGKTDDRQFKDVLSEATYQTKVCMEYFDGKFRLFQNFKLAKILFETTQPAHVIMIAAIVVLASLWHPRREELPAANALLNFVYLSAFAIYTGSQFWMTFVSGLALYFNLPRHHFGEVQRVLFPKYFTLNSAMSFVVLAIFTRNAQEIRGVVLHQVWALSISFIVNLVIRLYLTPPLLRFMHIKKAIEQSVGLGNEIGTANVGPLHNCPHYLRIHRLFRRVHMTIATGNIITMGCTVYHLYYLSHALCQL